MLGLGVSTCNLRLWFDLSSQPAVLPAEWQWIRGQNNRQPLFDGLSQRVILKRRFPISGPPALLDLWQDYLPFPSLIKIDLSNHYTQHLPSPDRWHISQRNARALISYFGAALWHQTLPAIRCSVIYATVFGPV